MVCAIWKLCHWGSEPRQIRFPNPTLRLTLSELVRLTSPRVIGAKHGVYFQLIFVYHRSGQSLLLCFGITLQSLPFVLFSLQWAKVSLCV